jgi:hypothetical protein
MRKIYCSILVIFGLLLGLQASHAGAALQASRTWVSALGDDANPCSRTAPCKTFGGAISKTAAHGEINLIDPGGYGGVTITKSISIIADVAQAGVLVSGTNAIVINAGPNDIVELQGLNITGMGTGLVGVKILSAGAVHIRKSLIREFSGASSAAIQIAATANPVDVSVSDTTITQNKQGVVAAPADGVSAAVTLNRVAIENTAGHAVHASSRSTIRVGNSTITNNNYGLFQGGTGQVISLGGNILVGNTIDGSFDSTLPQQ